MLSSLDEGIGEKEGCKQLSGSAKQLRERDDTTRGTARRLVIFTLTANKKKRCPIYILLSRRLSSLSDSYRDEIVNASGRFADKVRDLAYNAASDLEET